MELGTEPSSPEPESAPLYSSAALYENRLSLPPKFRISTASAMAFFAGIGLGFSHGGKTAGMRFRAENSHRFPTTQTGWFLYHKTKNYHIMLGGIKEGLKMGTKVSFWAGSFFLVEELVDQMRGTKDFVSTALAGLSIAGVFSTWYRFSMTTAMRLAKTGLYGGLAFGLAQDALGLARGRRLRYVDFISEMIGKAVDHKDAEKT